MSINLKEKFNKMLCIKHNLLKEIFQFKNNNNINKDCNI